MRDEIRAIARSEGWNNTTLMENLLSVLTMLLDHDQREELITELTARGNG